MNKFCKLGLAILTSATIGLPSLADGTTTSTDPQSYALDKLQNAQAQLDKLQTQRRAVDNLIQAVKKDLRAAKMRAKAERIQLEADSQRQDAALIVQQNGVAVDLPNLMTAKGVQAGVVEYQPDTNEIEMMFKDKNSADGKTVFFPGGDSGRKVDPADNR